MAKPTASRKPSKRLASEASARQKDDYLALGRTNQKLRTRDALIEVAAELIRAGREISVNEVADAARISRTTAYRYFPNSEVLAFQATLAAANVIDARELVAQIEKREAPEDKLDAVIAGSHAMTVAHEAAFRSLVRFTVEGVGDDPHNMRPTIRRIWVESALAPLKKELGPKRFAKLTGALCLFVGIESQIVLSDICQMERDEAGEVKRWAAQLLLTAALDENKNSREKRSKQ